MRKRPGYAALMTTAVIVGGSCLYMTIGNVWTVAAPSMDQFGATDPIVAEPGSDAAALFATVPALIEAGQVEAASIGGGDLSNLPLPPTPAWETVVEPDSSLAADPVVQQCFADLLAMFDPLPPIREAHFSWLPAVPGVTRVGWQGSIQSWVGMDETTAIVTVAFFPRLFAPLGPRTVIFDLVTETYAFSSDGTFELVYSDADIAHPELQNFPVVY